MGAADVVPGVSGGTMALITGIYGSLVRSVRAATSAAPWRALLRGDVRGAYRAAEGPFLLPLVLGIGLAVVLIARVVEAALHEWRVLLYAAFVGLILASVVVVGRSIEDRRITTVAIGIATAAAVYLLLGAGAARPSDATWFLVFSGAVGIAALVLPGVSGAFLLVLLGQYETVIGAIARGDLGVLAPFALGAVLGLATVARVLHTLLGRYPGPTMAALVGAMVGSLRRLWPWEAPSAADVAAAAAPPPGPWGTEGWAVAAVVAALAFAVVVAVERAARRDRFSPGS